MLATEPIHLYSSATFWAGVGTTATVLTLLTTVVFWLRGSPRRLLLYGLTSQVALLSSDAIDRAGIGTEVQVIVNGRTLTDPHVASVVMTNRSRYSDIRGSDFEGGQPLAIDVGTSIFQLLSADTGGATMPKIQLEIDGNQVLVKPGLIQRRQVISLELLTNGPATLNCPNPSLANVSIRDGTNDNVEPGWLIRVAYIGGASTLIGALVIEAYPTLSARESWVAALSGVAFWLGAGVLLIPAIAYLAIMAYRQGGLSRKRPWTRPVD